MVSVFFFAGSDRAQKHINCLHLKMCVIVFPTLIVYPDTFNAHPISANDFASMAYFTSCQNSKPIRLFCLALNPLSTMVIRTE